MVSCLITVLLTQNKPSNFQPLCQNPLGISCLASIAELLLGTSRTDVLSKSPLSSSTFIKSEQYPGQHGVQRLGGQMQQKVQKPMKDPNAPKKPMSAYFLFNQEERNRVNA